MYIPSCCVLLRACDRRSASSVSRTSSSKRPWRGEGESWPFHVVATHCSAWHTAALLDCNTWPSSMLAKAVQTRSLTHLSPHPRPSLARTSGSIAGPSTSAGASSSAAAPASTPANGLGATSSEGGEAQGLAGPQGAVGEAAAAAVAPAAAAAAAPADGRGSGRFEVVLPLRLRPLDLALGPRGTAREPHVVSRDSTMGSSSCRVPENRRCHHLRAWGSLTFGRHENHTSCCPECAVSLSGGSPSQQQCAVPVLAPGPCRTAAHGCAGGFVRRVRQAGLGAQGGPGGGAAGGGGSSQAQVRRHYFNGALVCPNAWLLASDQPTRMLDQAVPYRPMLQGARGRGRRRGWRGRGRRVAVPAAGHGGGTAGGGAAGGAEGAAGGGAGGAAGAGAEGAGGAAPLGPGVRGAGQDQGGGSGRRGVRWNTGSIP